jgi:hypothetical protein
MIASVAVRHQRLEVQTSNPKVRARFSEAALARQAQNTRSVRSRLGVSPVTAVASLRDRREGIPDQKARSG